MFRSRRKNVEFEDFHDDRNMFINFDQYTDEWDRQLRIIDRNNHKEVYHVRSNEYDLVMNSKAFEKVARRHNRRVFNNDNYHANQDLFLDNIKHQIFEETRRLMGGGNPTEGKEIPFVDDKYRTGYSYEDSIISIAADKDPKLLNLIEGKNDNDRINPSDVTDYEAIEKASHAKVRAISESALSEADRKKIKEYSNVSVLPDNPEEVSSEKWEELKKDIIEYADAQSADLKDVTKASRENTAFIQKLDVEKQTPAEKAVSEFENDGLAEVASQTKDLMDELKKENDFLQSKNNVVNPSTKPVTPIVTNEQRLQNLKELEDTNWEKIKSYVRDFNTNDKTVAIGNTSSLLDADNALKVDLNAKFYLSEQELNNIREKQANEFKRIIAEYEETLKKHEEKALSEIYDREIKKHESLLNSNARTKDTIDKKIRQNELSLKAIDENLKLKQQIAQLESELKKTAKKPEVEHRLAKFEMEKMIVDVMPANQINDNQDINKKTLIINDDGTAVESGENNQDNIHQFDQHEKSSSMKKPIVKIKLVNGRIVKEIINEEGITKQAPNILKSKLSLNNTNKTSNQNEGAIEKTPKKFSTLPPAKGIDLSKLLTRQKDVAVGSTHRNVDYNDMIRDNQRIRLSDFRNATDGNPINSIESQNYVSIKDAYRKK